MIEQWLKNKAIKKFYPTFASKQTCLTLVEAFEQLLDLVERGELFLSWEIRCPECFRTIKTVPEKSKYDFVECAICGEQIESTENIDQVSFPVFYKRGCEHGYIKHL